MPQKVTIFTILLKDILFMKRKYSQYYRKDTFYEKEIFTILLKDILFYATKGDHF